MGIPATILVYLLCWWMIFFMTLPWGTRPRENPEPGHAESAPARPRLWLKAAVTSVLAAVVCAVIYAVAEANIISFRRGASQ